MPEKGKPCGEQPQGFGSSSQSANTRHQGECIVSNTQIPASQEDGNSCVQPVGDAPARRMTPHDLRAATEMLDTIKNLTDDIREWQTASHCCVSPIVTGLYDTISIEVTDAVRTASINATRERIDQIRGWLGELGVDLDQDGGAA